MSSFAPDEEQKEFVYAGGEFENDAPYVPDEGSATDGGGGASDMDALLSDLIGSGSYDAAEDADTCFSMNAAASFAAISEPEEQVAELALQVLDAETLVNVVDVVTPVEVMQVTLLLEFLAEHTSASAPPNLPPALQTVPTLVVGRADAVSAWFARSEKSLMQALSLLGLSLNKETAGDEAAAASAAAAAPPSSASGPIVYTLLFRGTKVTSLSLIRSLLTDLFALLALPDVLDLDCLTKQLVKEMGAFVCDQRMANAASSASSLSLAASATSSSSSSSSPSGHPHLASLRSRFLGVSSTAVLTGSTFTVDLAAAHAAVVTLPAHDLATLRRMHHTRQDTDQPGELYVRVWVDHWQQCWLAVHAAVDKELASAGGAAAHAAVPIDAFLRSLTPQSALASLLSPESADAEEPGAFFAAFLAASRQMQQMEARREETPAATSALK